MDNTQGAPNQANEAVGPQLLIEKLYLKDCSYEAPHTPQVFRSEWKPQVNLDLNTRSDRLHDDLHEVILTVTVTVKTNNENAYLVEVKWAGIFSLKNFDPTQLGGVLGSYCPSLLYPYVCQTIGDLVQKGGFPQLNLVPINFDALYQDSLARQQGQGAKTAANDLENVSGDSGRTN